MSYPVSQLYSVPTPNGTLTAAQFNAEFQNVYANVGKPANIDDYSANVTEMQLDTDPGELGSESQATSMAGEIERLRFAIKEAKQAIDATVAHWYETPGAISLGSVANTDTFTIYAQNDAFTETVLTLKTDTVAGSGHNFLECISDVNGTPSTRVTLNGLGNFVTLGTVTTTGLLTVLDIPGVKADKLIMAEAGTGVNHITLQGPDSASTTTHVITFPGALPGAQSFMLMEATGNIGYTASPSATLSNAIRAATTRATGTTVGTGGVAISNAYAGGNFTNTTYGDVTNLLCTITTSGRPVMVMLQSNEPTGGMDWAVHNSVDGANGSIAFLKFVRDSTDIASFQLTSPYTTSNVGTNVGIPFCFLDAVAAGTYAYKVQVRVNAASMEGSLSSVKLVAFEI